MEIIAGPVLRFLRYTSLAGGLVVLSTLLGAMASVLLYRGRVDGIEAFAYFVEQIAPLLFAASYLAFHFHGMYARGSADVDRIRAMIAAAVCLCVFIAGIATMPRLR